MAARRLAGASEDIDPDITVVPSRRGFEPYFDHAKLMGRESYNTERPTPRYRPQALDAHSRGGCSNSTPEVTDHFSIKRPVALWASRLSGLLIE